MHVDRSTQTDCQSVWHLVLGMTYATRWLVFVQVGSRERLACCHSSKHQRNQIGSCLRIGRKEAFRSHFVSSISLSKNALYKLYRWTGSLRHDACLESLFGKLFLALFKVFDSILICCFIGRKLFLPPTGPQLRKAAFPGFDFGHRPGEGDVVRRADAAKEAFHGFGGLRAQQKPKASDSSENRPAQREEDQPSHEDSPRRTVLRMRRPRVHE